MKIAITGGTGFIGSYLVEELSNNKQFEFVVLGVEEANGLIEIAGFSVPFIQTDYSIESLKQIFLDCDGIIHLAARKPVSKSVQYTLSDFSGNIEIASNVFEASQQANVSNIVNVSSISVYGKQNILPLTESQEPRPDGFYGLSKVMIEKLADHYNRTFSMKIKSLRLAHVIGKEVDERYMFKVFIRKAIANETIILWGEGKGRREYIYVKDVTSALISGIFADSKEGVFNIGSGVNTSHSELAQLIVDIVESSSDIVFDRDKKEDTYSDIMNCEGINVDWFAKYSLKDAIEEIVVDLKGP